MTAFDAARPRSGRRVRPPAVAGTFYPGASEAVRAAVVHTLFNLAGALAWLPFVAVLAGIVDGMRLLDLGCGWGSLALWMAEHYPSSRITAVSNSATQKAHIDGRAAAAGLTNLEWLNLDNTQLSDSRRRSQMSRKLGHL